jgi:tripartite ATP-independent transporter DctM subunit
MPGLMQSELAATQTPASAPVAMTGRWLHGLDLTADGVVVVALLGELVLVLANVLARTFFNSSFLWSDEAARLALSILAFIGGAVGYRRREHAFVRIVLGMVPASVERTLMATADVIVVMVSLLVGFTSIDFITSSWAERTPILQLPAALIAAPLPIGMALMALYAGLHLRREYGARVLPIAAVAVAVIVVALLTQDYWLPLEGNGAIIAALALFFIAILAGVPVGFVLLMATVVYLWTSGASSMVVVPQSMANGTGNFILLAIPFFILAGLIMERGGISVRLVHFIHTLVGHLRGGLLQVTVVSMYVVSGLSGSKPADVAAVGTVMRDRITARLGAAVGAAVLAATAVMGETVPPSIAMLIVGSITNVSLAAMFIGGLIPAAVMAVCLMVMIYVRARRDGSPRMPRASREVVLHAGLDAVLPLLMPAILLGGVLFGVATPTEVAAVAVVYGLFLSCVIYRGMDLDSFMRTVIDTASLTGMLLFIFAASSGFSWTLTVAYLPQDLVEILRAVGNSAQIFMLCSIVLLVIVGILLEGLPSLNVLAPLLIPIAGKLGISEMHYALVLIIAMGVGGFMPLAGVGFYVCCAVMRCDIESASRAMLPYLIMILTGLLVVAMVPWFALVLPRYLGFPV